MHFTEKFALVAYANNVYALRTSRSRVVRRTRVAYVTVRPARRMGVVIATVPSRSTCGRRDRRCTVTLDAWTSWSSLHRHAWRMDVAYVIIPSCTHYVRHFFIAGAQCTYCKTLLQYRSRVYGTLWHTLLVIQHHVEVLVMRLAKTFVCCDVIACTIRIRSPIYCQMSSKP